jgi:hypothetical protein
MSQNLIWKHGTSVLNLKNISAHRWAGRAGHRRIRGSCVGSAYMGGQPSSMALGRSS